MSRILGHVNNSKTFSKHYQSDISAVDIKGLVLRNSSDLGFSTEILRRNRRLHRVPTKLSSRAQQEFLREWKEATWADPGVSRDTHGKRARTAAWKLFRSTWEQTVKSKSLSKPQSQPASSPILARSVEHLGRLDEHYTKSRIMLRYDRHRKTISDEIANSGYNIRTSPALDSMIMLAKVDYPRPARFYTGTEPEINHRNQTVCPFCGIVLSR